MRFFIFRLKIGSELTPVKTHDSSLHPTRKLASNTTTFFESESRNDGSSETQANPLKRKRPSPPPKKEDPKLKEFLNVMQAPLKSKSWMNEVDTDIQEEPQAMAVQPPAVDEGQSDEEYQAVPKKQKAVEDQIIQRDTRDESEEPLTFSNVARSHGSSNGFAAGDDTNWLKSRTGQLLGLEEQDEAHTTKFDVAKLSADTDDGSDNEVKDSSLPTKPIPAASINRSKEDTSQLEAQIRSSKRLFLRNLPFTITEEALMDEFSSFGSLEEVRCDRILSAIHNLLHDEA